MTIRGSVAAWIGVALWLGAGWSEARACTCVPSSRLAWPSSPDSVPSNARLVFEPFCGGEPEQLVVTSSDGSELALVAVPDHPVHRGDLGVYELSPTPMPGTFVTLACNPDMYCRDQGDVVLSIVDAEHDPPPAPAIAIAHEAGERMSFECGQPLNDLTAETVEWIVALAAEASDEPVAYFVELQSPAGEPLGASAIVPAAGGGADTESRLALDADETPEEVCVVARAVDRAGNVGEATRECDEIDTDALLGRGCACTSEPSPAAPLSTALVVLALAGWRGRARR